MTNRELFLRAMAQKGCLCSYFIDQSKSMDTPEFKRVGMYSPSSGRGTTSPLAKLGINGHRSIRGSESLEQQHSLHNVCAKTEIIKVLRGWFRLDDL